MVVDVIIPVYRPEREKLTKLIDWLNKQTVKPSRVFFMQTGAGSRQAETVCAGIGLRRVEINPLSYDWKKEMRRIADGITSE